MGYKDPDKQREFNRGWMSQRRCDWIISQGGRCVKCGSTDRLEADHIDPITKLFSPAKLWSLSEDNEKRIEELAKCQVLCHECHKIKTREQLVKPLVHGTLYAYKSRVWKCRCTECRAANAEWLRSNRLNKKQ